MNKHLSFVPLPEKINTTQLSYDISRFSRTCRWTEDLKDVPRVDEDTIFKVKKHNLPRKAPSTTLSKFLYGIESDILKAEPKRIHSNLKDDEHKAIKSLVEAQKEGQIVIQRCDKGGATAIMDRDDYVNEIMEQHLQSTVTNQDGDIINVYREVDPLMLHVHHDKLRQLVEQGFQAGFLNEKEKAGLIPEKPGEARAYGMPKAHKAVPEGKKIPPVRLVISGCGSTTENASLFVDHHTKHIPTQLPSYIQDTPDFLRLLERENTAGKQSKGAFPVTIDVVGLYPNIPQAEGLIAFEKMVSDPVNRDQTLPAGFLVLLLKCVLEYNVFTFDGKYYLQAWGTAIGSRVAPTYACIFMGVLEQMMLQGWTGWVPRIWKRYIDDIFNVWESTEEELLQFLTFINSFHPTIKFTAEYRTTEEQVTVKPSADSVVQILRVPLAGKRPKSVDFLDTTVWIDEDGLFQTDLYVKDTDRVTYLSPSSCHPGHITRNIPYSLGYRLKRICSNKEDFDKRKLELSLNLRSRGYTEDILQEAFKRLEKVTREEALKKVIRNKEQKLVFAVTFDPRLPSISKILKKHYEIGVENPEFQETFPDLPSVGYRRYKNLGGYLTRAKLYPKTRSGLRTHSGFQRCTRVAGGNCMMCMFSQNTSKHTSAYTGEQYNIQSNITCTDHYIIYSIQCKKCPSVEYVGKTVQEASERFSTHRSDVNTKKIQKPVAEHFNLPGHSVSDMKFLPFEKIFPEDDTLLREREKFWIKQKKTFLFGLNKIC